METLVLNVGSATLRQQELKAELRLGHTKTDVRGTGCRLSFECTCRTALPMDPCPYHALERAGSRLRAFFTSVKRQLIRSFMNRCFWEFLSKLGLNHWE